MKYFILNSKNQLFKLVLFFWVVFSIITFPIISYSDDAISSQEIFPLQWLLLNYYNESKISKNYESEITNEDFFLNKNGRYDPEAEFITFKKYLKEYLKDGSHLEVMCRFPARFSLFIKQYNWVNSQDRPQCLDYQKTNQANKIKSVSLLLANGYFENPASYFGHSLIKFNYDETKLTQKSVDASLNYGANIDDQDPALIYVISGLFGLYDGVYTRNNDVIYTNLYTHSQMRDVWEYELNLTQDEIKLFVEHSWEMSYAKFKYYFINDNCAHRILKLIELAKGKKFIKTHGFWLTPTQMVRQIANNSEIVKKVTYNPSLQTIFFKKYNIATINEKRNFNKFIRLNLQKNYIEQKNFVKNLNSGNLLMILDYLDLQVARATTKIKDENNLANLHKQRAIILSQLYQRPVENIVNDFAIKQPTAPNESKPTSVFRLGYGNIDGENYAKIGYRIANNDLLNIPVAGQEISQFRIGDIEIQKSKNDIDLSSLVIAEIISLNTNPTSLNPTPSFEILQELSWAIKLDYAAKNNLCTNCSDTGLEMKIGKASRLNERSLFYLLSGGRLHTENNNNYFTGKLNMGTIFNITDNNVLNLSLDIDYDTYNNDIKEIYRADFSYNASNNLDYRINIETDNSQIATFFTIGFYFD